MIMVKVVKIGGNVVDNPVLLNDFLKNFASLEGPKVLVHGGGVMATQLQKELGIEPKMIEGRRVTDAETLRIVTMVYAGWCNKQIVAKLQGFGCNALGLSGCDANVIRAEKRKPVVVGGKLEEAGELNLMTLDYGFVGDLDSKSVDAELLLSLTERGVTPVLCAITHDGNGNLLNTNADTIASAVAVAIARVQSSELFYCFEKDGVLYDKEDDDSVIPELDLAGYEVLKKEGRVAAGMIPKLDNAFRALDAGVGAVTIKHAANIMNTFGTCLKA